MKSLIHRTIIRVTTSTAPVVLTLLLNTAVMAILSILFVHPSPAVSATTPKPVAGLYETLRSTPVYSRPSENSQRVTTIEAGLEVLVVNVRGDWLEVRSRHGRGSGFIRRENARFVKALRPPQGLSKVPH